MQSIVVAAQSGDIDEMLPVLEENELPPMLSDKAVGDPIAFWKKASADGKGQRHARRHAERVQLWLRAQRRGQGGDVYLALFRRDGSDQADAGQEVELYRIVPPPQAST